MFQNLFLVDGLQWVFLFLTKPLVFLGFLDRFSHERRLLWVFPRGAARTRLQRRTAGAEEGRQGLFSVVQPLFNGALKEFWTEAFFFFNERQKNPKEFRVFF